MDGKHGTLNPQVQLQSCELVPILMCLKIDRNCVAGPSQGRNPVCLYFVYHLFVPDSLELVGPKKA